MGFWGLKNEKNNEKSVINEGIIDMILKFLESSLIGNVDDLEYTDVILCLSLLYIWIYTLKSRIEIEKKIEKIMDIILGLLLTISYKSKGNPQLFWLDGLLPHMSGVNIGKSIRQKLKSFVSGGVSPFRYIYIYISKNRNMYICIHSYIGMSIYMYEYKKGMYKYVYIFSFKGKLWIGLAVPRY